MKHLLVLMIGLFSIALSSIASSSNEDNERHIKLLLRVDGLRSTFNCCFGSGPYPEECEEIIPEIPVTDEGTSLHACHMHDVINLRTGGIIGEAIDATADIYSTDDADSGNLVGTGTTIFNLRRGTFAVRGTGNIQMLPSDVDTSNSVVLDGATVTHIAGIFAQQGDNNVVYGDGAFKDAEGTFSLFGALDLTNAADPIDPRASYNCNFDIDLKLHRRRADRNR